MKSSLFTSGLVDSALVMLLSWPPALAADECDRHELQAEPAGRFDAAARSLECLSVDPVAPLMHLVPVKSGNLDAKELLREASRRSPSVNAMIAALEQTDLIVLVERTMSPAICTGSLRFVDAGRETRLLRIAISSRVAIEEQIAWLGHELQHALEIGAATEVRGQESAIALYQRIGWRTSRTESTFETQAALDVRKRVWREVFASPATHACTVVALLGPAR